MRFELLPLATRVVRAWTRVYTHGLPPAERTARQAEIDSDLWEFEHDPDASRGGWAATQVMARLLIGIPDDLAWRMDLGAAAHRAPARTLAAAGTVTGSRRVSAFGLAATIHLVAISAVTWVASSGPVLPPIHGAVAADKAGIEHRLPSNASFGNQRASRERRNGRVTTMSAQSGPTPVTARAFGFVRAVALAVAARVGLSPPPRLAAQAPSQPSDRFVAKILPNRYSLSVRNGQLSGTGAEVLQSAIAQSRFVLLGENHGLAQTPELGTAVCHAAGVERFQTMAIEEGPAAAAALESWARRRDGVAQLTAFEKTFPAYSLGIYNSREEFEMLQQCARAAQGEFHLWGLNQEALGAAGPILSRILEMRLGESARSAMQQLRRKDVAANRRALQTGGFGDLFMVSADDQELARGAAVLEHDGNPEARSLFASLVESHEINRVPPMEYDNARRRERLMKTRFADDYARAARTAAAPPRILLKFGAYHIYRGLNPVRGSGIGNYIAEFAEAQRVQSLHIRLIAVKGSEPFYPRIGQPAQLRPFNLDEDPRSQYLQPLLSTRLPSDWTMFDLRPLRNDLNLRTGAMNPELATLVYGIDMLVIVPEGTPSVAIR